MPLVRDGEDRACDDRDCDLATASVIADSETVDVYIMEGYFINILFGRKQELAGRFYKYLAHELQRRVEIPCNKKYEKIKLTIYL